MQDYYALLNVNPAISLEDLKTEIFNVKKIQTGRASGAPNADLRRKAEDTLKALETARKVFDSNASRANYDRELAEHKKNQYFYVQLFVDESEPFHRVASKPENLQIMQSLSCDYNSFCSIRQTIVITTYVLLHRL